MAEQRIAARQCVVVMGPSGVGKTTVAEMIAETLGWRFAEADEFHPKANIDKMAAGIALDDEDRWPWLRLIRDWMGEQAHAGGDTVITCSALKRRYRDLLREAPTRVRFLELTATKELIMTRLPKRKGHYMPVSLLDSQFEALEELEADEDGVKVDVGADPQTIVRNALAALDLDAPEAAPKAAAAR